MESEAGRTANLLRAPILQRLARAVPALDVARAMALANRLTRRDWRRLRRLIGRPNLPDILAALLNDQLERARQLPRPPVPWQRAQALEALQSERDRASLFGAVRILQAATPSAERLGYAINPDREAVRLDQGLVLGYVGREVAEIKAGREDAAGLAPRGWTGRPVLTQNAIGLLGPNGPMPNAWTQHARNLPTSGPARPRQSFLAFMNLVQRRQLGLLYRAWSDAQPITAMDSPGGHPHPIEARLSALAGLAQADLQHRDAVSPPFKLAFAGVLSRRVRSPGALAAMLARYLGESVSVNEFSCRWLEIPVPEQTRLGQAYCRLGDAQGDAAVAGRRTWDCSTRFDLVVGPVDLAGYLALLPGQPLHEELRDLVSLYVGPECEWRLQPLLRGSQVPANQLGGRVARLGMTAWLGRRPADSDARDLHLRMAPNFGARQAQPAPAHAEFAEA